MIDKMFRAEHAAEAGGFSSAAGAAAVALSMIGGRQGVELRAAGAAGRSVDEILELVSTESGRPSVPTGGLLKLTKGGRVRLIHLVKREDLNGREGKVLHFHLTSGQMPERIQVKLDDQGSPPSNVYTMLPRFRWLFAPGKCTTEGRYRSVPD